MCLRSFISNATSAVGKQKAWVGRSKSRGNSTQRILSLSPPLFSPPFSPLFSLLLLLCLPSLQRFSSRPRRTFSPDSPTRHDCPSASLSLFLSLRGSTIFRLEKRAVLHKPEVEKEKGEKVLRGLRNKTGNRKGYVDASVRFCSTSSPFLHQRLPFHLSSNSWFLVPPTCYYCFVDRQQNVGYPPISRFESFHFNF